MRKTNEEFAAEVLRRSAEYKRSQISLRRQIRTAAACFVVLCGSGILFFTALNLARSDKASSAAPPAKENYVSTADSNEPPPKSVSTALTKQSSASIRIETEQSAYLSGTKTIPVKVTNLSSEPVSVHPYQFTATQGELEFAVSIDISGVALKAMTVTIPPGSTETIPFRAEEYHIQETEGFFTLHLLDAETEFYYGNKE